MRSLLRTFRKRCFRCCGLTLVEMLVSFAILGVVTGIIIVGVRALRASQAQSIARQQISVIASAIDRYAEFWPQWKVIDTSGTVPFLVTIADRGWPDHIPGRLFDDNIYDSISMFNTDVQFLVSNGIITTPDGDDEVRGGDVLSANICLAYALTSASGKGPYLNLDDEDLILRDVAQVISVGNPLLPGLNSGPNSGQAQRAQVLVDPWETPYRYFWVYRDTATNQSQRAYKGYLPVDYGSFLSGSGPAGVQNSAMFQDTTDAGTFKKAVGYVLESAGPDKQFGNVWKADPTPDEISAAADNIIRLP